MPALTKFSPAHHRRELSLRRRLNISPVGLSQHYNVRTILRVLIRNVRRISRQRTCWNSENHWKMPFCSDVGSNSRGNLIIECSIFLRGGVIAQLLGGWSAAAGGRWLLRPARTGGWRRSTGGVSVCHCQRPPVHSALRLWPRGGGCPEIMYKFSGYQGSRCALVHLCKSASTARVHHSLN